MHLEEVDVLEFQELYRKKFNKDISREAAYEGLIKLVSCVNLICKPITKAELEKTQKRFKELGITTE